MTAEPERAERTEGRGASAPAPAGDARRGPGHLERLKTGLAGRYAIRGELGAGGMAIVYLADDVKHGRTVALKVLHPELSAVLGPERFHREVEIAARLNHPHILALYDSGEVDGFLYYAMPHVEGGSLRGRIDRDGQLPVDEALDLGRKIASALAYAHRKDVVHRDIKPENVLLHEGEAMVADFGIALAVRAAADGRLTRVGLALGTPEYMSPEQALGDRDVDARADQYSLACVLFELLAGEPPYTGPTAQSVITKRLVDPVPAVRRLRAAVPLGVERALMKALAPLPADRFASMVAFMEALTEPTPVPPPSRCVAVLPFLNLSADPENEYFADGVTEDVIAQLSKVRSLKVISRTSVMAFKNRQQGLREIAARLDAETLLDGSVRRVGDRVRIVAQLVDARTDQHLWAETYDRQLTDIFAIQADVALHIAAALEAKLSPDERSRIHKEPTGDVEAYQLYLRGRHWFIRYTPEGIRRSIEYFERALERAPGYALAHVGVALALVELAEGGAAEPGGAYVRARRETARALELDGELAEAHTVLGVIRYVSEFDWTAAEREFRRALELNPSGADTYDYYGRMLSAMGRHEEAIAAQRRAQELDPLAHPLDVATALLRAGRYDEALEAASQVIELDPNYARAHATIGWAYLKTGSHDEGIAALEKAVTLSRGMSMWLAQLGQAYGSVGRVDDAREVLRRLEEMSRSGYVAPYHRAYVYTGLGDGNSAMDWLERAFQERSGAIHGVKGSFLFESLRPHPRFGELLRKMNLA